MNSFDELVETVSSFTPEEEEALGVNRELVSILRRFQGSMCKNRWYEKYVPKGKFPKLEKFMLELYPKAVDYDYTHVRVTWDIVKETWFRKVRIYTDGRFSVTPVRFETREYGPVIASPGRDIAPYGVKCGTSKKLLSLLV